MSDHCPVCGCKVEIIGHTTKSYKPIDKSEKLAEALEFCLQSITWCEEFNKNEGHGVGRHVNAIKQAKQALEEYRNNTI